jgi:hypothetical protein
MTIGSTEYPFPDDAEERIRRCLEDLKIAHERTRGREGVSCADMARALGVSDQRMADILDVKKPNVNLRAGQVNRLPPTARRAVMALLEEDARRLDEACAPARTVASRHRKLSSLVGRHGDKIDRALLDGRLDGDEHAELRASLCEIASEAGAGLRDDTAGDGCDRVSGVPDAPAARGAR